jgi:SAM-dependent methyltransferase
MMDDYSSLKGYVPDADLGLGCGLPTEFAGIQTGHVVIDLGSGAGNDAFVARHLTGPEGKVLGIDFTESMIQKARENAEKLNFHNVEFRYGDIEDLPVNNEVADVIVSNCVLNLVPDKAAVMKEMFRVLKKGGHFSVSDIVIQGDLPEALKKSAEMYAGCVAGAIQKDTYLELLQKSGFEEVNIQRQKTISLPDDILNQYLDSAAIEAFKASETGIFSITVYGRKPGTHSTAKPKMALADLQDENKPGGGCC